MDIQTNINWIHQEIDKVRDENFIEKLKHLLISFGKTETNEEYNKDIEIALKNIANGNYYTENEAIEISKKWGRK